MTQPDVTAQQCRAVAPVRDAYGFTVGWLRCTLPAWHEVADEGWPSEAIPGATFGAREATPHRAIVEWPDDANEVELPR